MNVRTIVLWGIIGLLLFQPACQNPTEPDQVVTPLTTNVRGTVLRNDNLAPVANAIVYDLGGLVRDTSKSDGTFKLAYELLSQTHTRIVATRAGFGNDTAVVTLNPGIDTTIALRVKADSTSPSGTTSSNGAANIVLISVSTDNISIRGTGANETTVLLFEVRDSLGVPIGGANKLKVDFSILGGPGGEEYVFPVSGDTDPLTGRVGTRVTAGKKAGVLQVVASGTVTGTSKVIKSSPVRITISGGLPVAERFSLSRLPMNIAGGVYDNLRASVVVIVGDKEGNPVQAGTAVSFTTTGGIIQPNAVTDKDGIATVSLISGNPRPQNSVAIVTAKTIGDSGVVIQKSIPVLFSGPTRILTPATLVVVPDSGVASFEYRVQDPNGFPLSQGTAINLTVDGPGSGQLELSGDVTKTLDDSDDPSTTLFRATVRDKQLRGPAGSVTFKLSVTSQNGNSTVTFPGSVLSDTSVVVAPSKSGYISSLTLVGIDNSQLSVSGTGANETAKMRFIAKDSVGNPVELRKRAYVTFSLSPVGGVGGGEFLFPAADSTDGFGEVATTFNAGSRSGVLQVVARAVAFGRVITSSPIRITISGGLPDSNRFTATLSSINMPGLIKTGSLGTVKVQVGDKFGNAVQPGTALSFSTQGGLIQATATTDNEGQASATIYGGNPAPNETSLGGIGHGYIIVQTVGEGGVAIRKNVPFLFSGATRIAPPTSTISIPDSGVASFQYRVQDVNGNPLVAGTTVALTVDGPGSGELELSGDVGKTLLDTDDQASTLMTATVRDKVLKGTSGAVTFKISVASPNGNAVMTFPGVVLKDTATVPTVLTPGKSGYASNLTVVSISTPEVSVRGTGANEAARVTFMAKDSVGNPVELPRRASVTFSMSPLGGLGGGEFLYPVSDSTDANGQVATTFNAGTRSGVLQIVARAVVNGRTISSSPVRITVSQGLPDPSHFTATLTPSSILSWPTSAGAKVGTVSVQVGDRYGNPVQPNTALYFSTNAGVIQPKALTDANGMASVELFGGNPMPQSDSAQISVQTVGEGGVSITRTLSLYVTSTFRSGFASGLTLLPIESSQLSVRGTGSTETATLTFVAKDSAGNLLDVRRRIFVNFALSPTGGIGGGEFVSPVGAYTDSLGQVKTTFNSGVRSGVVQVVATANVLGRTISVASGRLTISGGFPDSTKLTATLSRVNMPGIAKSGAVGVLSVQLGDKFGNPVQPGTALSFSSSGGLIQPFAQTDASGLATVTLQGGNPIPNDPILGPGYGRITLQTIGENGTSISRSIPFLFSGAPRVTLQNVPTDTLKIFDGATADVDYTVADINGNPVSAGHSVSVSVSGQGAGGVALSGDIGVTTPDTQDKTNFTRYRFRVSDNVTNGGGSGDLVFSITVSGESGTFVRRFYGILYPPQIATTVPSTARTPSQIAFLGITNGDIYVAGVGNTENTVISYEVRDSLGVAIDKSRRVFATYSMQFFPNSVVGGGTPPTIVPASDSTDDAGKLRASIVSGTQAGVIQLVARIQLSGGTTILSQPVKVTVHAGFPDQAHFTLIPSRYVFPGFDAFTTVGFSVAVGDTFSNPVQQGTALYFHSQAGVMLTGTTSGASYTNATGLASASLYTVNPRPAVVPYYDPTAGAGRLGYHWIYVQTQGNGSRKIIDSALVVWNKAPIVVTGAPAATVLLPNHGSSPPISITIKDANGNPLCDGTTITTTVTVVTTTMEGVKFGVSGDLSSNRGFTMPNAGYARYPGPNITDFTFVVSDVSLASASTLGMSFLVEIAIDAPGLATRIISFNCLTQ